MMRLVAPGLQTAHGKLSGKVQFQSCQRTDERLDYERFLKEDPSLSAFSSSSVGQL